MSRRYVNPPVVEAVCEFRFSQDTDWDLTIPGLLYEKVKGDFPTKRQKLLHEVEIAAGSAEVGPVTRSSERIWFLTSDERAFIQLAPRLLAVNSLRPYPSWQGFRPMVEKALEALAETADLPAVQRIGLRYINRIEIPSAEVQLEDYFSFTPFLAEHLPQEMASFIVGCVLPLHDGRDACRVQLTNAVAEEPDHCAFLLDLDYFLAKPGEIDSHGWMDWVESAHGGVEGIFEGCISQKLRDIFVEAE